MSLLAGFPTVTAASKHTSTCVFDCSDDETEIDLADPSSETGQDDSSNPSFDFDYNHQRILRGLQDTAIWLDSFFGSDRIDEAPTANSEMRLSWDNEFREGENPNTRLRLRGKLRLPHLNKRLQLVFEGEPDKDDPSGLKQQNATSSVRYSVMRSALRSVDFDVGFRGGLTDPRLFTRLRMQRTVLHNDYQLHRLTPAISWDTREGWELYVRHDAEFKPKPKIFFRTTTKPGWSEEKAGYTFEQNFTVFRELTTHRYIAFDWLNQAVLHPYSDFTSRFRLRHRHALKENMLYLEVAPGVRFEQENNYRMEWEGYISLEMVFSPNLK